MSRTVVRVLAVLAAGVALWTYLRYFGDFSSNQSWAVTVLACIALALFREFRYARKASQGGEFAPFYVEVRPKWPALLKDFGLITNDAEMNRLWENSANTIAAECNVVRDGIAFTVLQRQSEALLPGLTFWDSRKRFLNGAPDFREAIRDIKIDSGFPELYFRASSDPNPMHDVPNSGIDWKNCKPEFVWELGLIVPEKWWRRACDADSTLAQVLTETDIAGPPPPANKRLIIARLPYSEFDIYFRPDIHYHHGGHDMRELKRRSERLSSRGWEWDRDEVPGEYGVTTRHKYFTVYHRELRERVDA